MHRCYNDAVSYAFLLAFIISPSITLDSSLVSDNEDSNNDGDKPTKPADLLEELKWYSPPPVKGLAALALPAPPVCVFPTTILALSNQS